MVYQGADSTYPNAYATAFFVEYTENPDAGWQIAAEVTDAAAGKNIVTFAPVTARYIRIHVQKKYSDNASFLELMVYETNYNGTPEEEIDPMRILFIGNSLTYYNDVADKVKDLFAADGQEIEVEKLIQLGQPLTLHASLPETKNTILTGDFDYVVLQDKASNFNGEQLMTGVTTIQEWIAQTDAKTVLYMPWANKSVLKDTQSYFTESYVAAAKAVGAQMAPAGEAWYELYYDYGYDWYSDNIHANNTGSLVSADAIFYTITGKTEPIVFDSKDSVVTKNNVTAELMNLIQERCCAYAVAYADLEQIQLVAPGKDKPESPSLPETETSTQETESESQGLVERPTIPVTEPVDPNLQKVSNGAVATASTEIQKAVNVVDGNGNSRWESAFTDEEWICLDLGAMYDISEITIQWETAAGKTYVLQVSEDGTEWTTVYTVTDGQSKAYLDAVLEQTATGRYVRMYGQERAATYGYSIYEMGVYAKVASDYFTGKNLALGKETGASSGNSMLAVDGKGDTRWESDFAETAYSYVDLGAEYKIDTVNLIWEAAYGKAYTIETSVDGNTWTPVFTETAGDGVTDTIQLAEVTARYVMLYGTKRATQYGYSLWEFEVYGGLESGSPEKEEETTEAESSVNPFTDVKEGTWYYASVKQVYELGLMTGINSITFAPNGTMTRGMVASVLYRMAGSPDTTYKVLFSDVSSGKYYSLAVTWAAENKIVNGFGDGKFRPTANITREQLAVILYHYADLLGLDTSGRADLTVYKDGKQISNYAKESMGWAVANGILSGTATGELKAKNDATRAEVAKILLNFYQLIEK